MDYTLHLQDPTANTPTYLFEAIVGAARHAKNGRAIFAFASRDGVDALLDDPELVALLKRGTLDLIVGIDAVTTRAALQRLLDRSRSRPSLRPFVFWNETDRLFHPKLCHFGSDTLTTLLVGSGNLTHGGLQSHFEAFVRLTMTSMEASKALRSLDEWVSAHAAHLRPIDEAALARADQNSGRQWPALELDAQSDVRPHHDLSSVAPVLVAEVPRSGDRWNQVNFDLNTIQDFFDVIPGSTQRLFLHQCLPGDADGRREVRPCVDSGRSRNYRIEIAACKGHPYPSSGRPILVFIKTAPRVFRYQLVLPDEEGYVPLARMLSRARSPKRSVRRLVVTGADLRQAWPANGITESAHAADGVKPH
jgi:hypothetical protein